MKQVLISRSSWIYMVYARIHELAGWSTPELESTCGVRKTLILAPWVLLRYGSLGLLRPYPLFLIALTAWLCLQIPEQLSWAVVLLVIFAVSVVVLALTLVGIIAALLIAWVVVELLSLIGPLCRAWDWFVTKETRIRGRQIYLHELVFLGLVAIGQAFLGVRALEGRAWAEDMFLTCLAFEGVILFFGGFFSLMSWLFRKEEEEQLVSLTIEKWALKAEAIADSRAMQVTLNTWQTLVVLTKDFKDKVCHPVQWVP